MVNRISFSSILQIWYVEVRISRTISENPVEFEITRVDCIYNFIPMHPRTRLGYIKWILLENHCVYYRIFHYNFVSPGTRWDLKCESQSKIVSTGRDLGCAGKKITECIACALAQRVEHQLCLQEVLCPIPSQVPPALKNGISCSFAWCSEIRK